MEQPEANGASGCSRQTAYDHAVQVQEGRRDSPSNSLP
jgi:hypothetical protein